MLEKALNFLLWLTGLFDRKRRSSDPILEEKRAREQRLVVSFVSFLGCVLLALWFDPTTLSTSPMVPADVVMSARSVVSLAFAAGGALAFAWYVLETVGYWRFVRREGVR